MHSHQIEVDEDVWQILQKNAQPLVDTPNSVLRRLLSLEREKVHLGQNAAVSSNIIEPLNFPPGTSEALQQIMEVVWLVKKYGYDRTDATLKVAENRRINRTTVADKYTRQFGNINSQAFDLMLSQPDLTNLESCLKKEFGDSRDFIRTIIGLLRRTHI